MPVNLRESWSIGGVEVPTRIVLAPMAGVSIQAFRRQGRRFGSNFSSSELERLPLNTGLALYDGYLYLVPGTPPDEPAMFLRYLRQVADIYDVIGRPDDPLPDWQDLARRTLTDLQDPDTWVKLNGKRSTAGLTRLPICPKNRRQCVKLCVGSPS